MKHLRLLFGFIVPGQNVGGDNDEEIRACTAAKIKKCTVFCANLIFFTPAVKCVLYGPILLGTTPNVCSTNRACRRMSDARFMEKMA